MRNAGAPVTLTSDVTYDARGQRVALLYGSGVTTTHSHNPATGRKHARHAHDSAWSGPGAQGGSPYDTDGKLRSYTQSYVYDAAGTRIRKVVEQYIGGDWVHKSDVLYLGGFELQHTFSGTTLWTERETLHAHDGDRRLALVETKTVDDGDPVTTPTPLLRYQLDNHVRSATVETSANGAVISHEEFHPYGTTADHAADNTLDDIPKRYRYSGKETGTLSATSGDLARAAQMRDAYRAIDLKNAQRFLEELSSVVRENPNISGDELKAWFQDGPYRARNESRTAVRRATPVMSRVFLEVFEKEKHRTVEYLWTQARSSLSNSPTTELEAIGRTASIPETAVAERAVQNSANLRPSANKMARVGRAVSRGLVLVDVGISAYMVASAEEANRLETTYREAGGLLGGIAGAALAALAIGTPVGWVATGAAILAVGLAGLIGSLAGQDFGSNAFTIFHGTPRPTSR